MTTFWIRYLIILQLADEWNNFMERINCKKDSEIWETEENILQLRHWVSLRGQTLCRTSIGCIPFSCFIVLISLLYWLFFVFQFEEWCTTDELWSFRLSLTWQMKVVRVFSPKSLTKRLLKILLQILVPSYIKAFLGL